jgi:succinate dehydrogenase hydrophobic anchor subunit
MTAIKPPPLPRDTTRQSQGLVYGWLSKLINRITGLIIVAFLAVHVGGLAIVHVDALRPVLNVVPWLADVHEQSWFNVFYAFLFVAITFHTLYSLKLIAMDLGIRVHYRSSFWVISALSIAAGLAWGVFGDA